MVKIICSKGFLKQLQAVLAVVLLCLAGGVGHAETLIITEKNGLKPIPIAMPNFVELGPDGRALGESVFGRKIVKVVTADLERSGLIRPLDPDAYLQDSLSLWKGVINYRSWQKIGADAVVSGAISDRGHGRFRVQFFVQDTNESKPMGKRKAFTAMRQDWRAVAHRISDEIYTRLTGEGPYFSTRIAFVAENGRKRRVAIMDQDGANIHNLATKQTLVMSPTFSPDRESLFYMSYESGEPRIYRWEMFTGKKRMIGNYKGLNSTPAWSPDGRYIAMTLSKDGNPEIYLMNLQTRKLKRLTFNRSIDTSPTWSPDGKRIAFTSKRSGKPQIYVMNADGRNQKRITFTGRYNTAPAWSPRGDWIAFIHGGGNKFRVAITDPKGKRMRILTDSWMDDMPDWSPNGRVIVFARQEGDNSRLYTIDLTGHNEREVPLPSGVDGSNPSWSPLIR